jgi:formate hydrogenlyase subunit 6/NADH:ubiquinone oxidoreductase subunit I
MNLGDKVTFSAESLGDLFRALEKGGYSIVGPTIRDGAVVYDRVSTPAELPQGWSDQTDSAKYRLNKNGGQAYFGFNVGPQSWKKFLFPSRRRLWSAERDRLGFTVKEENREFENLALFGVRPCELAAIKIHDRVFGEGEFRDPTYIAARKKTFIVALNCGQAGGTCFCASMGTGPKAQSDFDLALTEITDGDPSGAGQDRHYFTAEIGSEKGSAVIGKVPTNKATKPEIDGAQAVSDRVAGSMGRTLDTNGIKALLERNFEHSRWEAVAKRCLTCANCTMVCPTCFCSTVEDVTDLTGKSAERWQRWDSCYTMDFSYIHGGSIRPSTKARYRQWATHKLASWYDQFGVSGCVGCGRCIAWCPAAIDITEEVRAIRDGDRAKAATASIKESKYANT